MSTRYSIRFFTSSIENSMACIRLISQIFANIVAGHVSIISIVTIGEGVRNKWSYKVVCFISKFS